MVFPALNSHYERLFLNVFAITIMEHVFQLFLKIMDKFWRFSFILCKDQTPSMINKNLKCIYTKAKCIFEFSKYNKLQLHLSAYRIFDLFLT